MVYKTPSFDVRRRVKPGCGLKEVKTRVDLRAWVNLVKEEINNVRNNKVIFWSKEKKVVHPEQ